MASKSVMSAYFKKVEGGRNCKLCNCFVKTSGNTTNLKNHFKRKHPSINIKSTSTKSSHFSRTQSESEEIDNPDNIEMFEELAENIISTAQKSQISMDTILSKPSTSSTSRSNSSNLVDTDSVISHSSSSCCNLKQPTFYQSLNEIRSYEEGGFKTNSINNALIYMIAKDNLPLSITEKTGFNYFMRKLAPMYKVPSRKTITNLISYKYNVLSTIIKNKLSHAENITLTADIWTDVVNNKSFLGMTAHFLSINKHSLENVTIGVLELSEHHTSENISSWFKELLDEWGIHYTKIFVVVTDNDANILSAIKNTFGRDKHLPCFAHTLNLVTQNALDKIDGINDVINKIKNLVTFFKQSISANDELNILSTLKLKQSVPTRWNSVFLMIDRFIQCSNHVDSIIIKFPSAPAMLSASELHIAKEITCILKPFEAATRELCGQNYITGSTIIPLINCLFNKCESIQVSNEIVLQLKTTLLQNLKNRFGWVEETIMLSIATILDPRFKNLHFNNPVAYSKAIQSIKLMLDNLKTDEIGSCQGSSDDEASVDNLWSIHKELVTKKAKTEYSEHINEQISTDLEHYLSLSTIAINENVFKFWEAYGSMYPLLRKVAEPYLSVVATSVPSEQLFSKSGHIMTDSRNRLKGEKLQQLLFLNSLDFDEWRLES